MKIRRFLSVFFLLLLFTTVLSPCAYAIETMDVAAKAALLVDVGTGDVLYAENEHEQLYPASVTKITTALLVLEAIDAGKLSLDQTITVTESALEGLAADGSTAGIQVGEVLSVKNLLYCVLVVSANEACNILGEAVSGSVAAFVEDMNTRVQELGCANTHYTNTTGLQDPDHYTSAWDIYLIAQECMTHETFREICSTKSFELPATNLSPARTFHTTNSLLSAHRSADYLYEYATGIKTGSTSDAGYCLLASAAKGDRELISVVLGAQRVDRPDGTQDTQSFSETIRLFDWGFDQFSQQTILSADEMITELPVALSRETNYVALHPNATLSALLPKDITAEELQREVKLYQESVNAPVTEGTVYGEITVSYDGKIRGSAQLVAYSDISASKLLTLRHELKLFFARPVVKIITLVVVLVLLLVIYTLFFRRRRRSRRYGSSTRPSRNYRGKRR